MKPHAPPAIAVIAVLCTLGFFGVVGGLMFHLVPADNRELLNQMVSLLGVAVLKLIDMLKDKLHPAPPVQPVKEGTP